ncbi:MAG: hypothetical protein LUE24_14850 [Lachnospiraceae bacterium]|nr:hypothetical protein [Lachnospiraceae bacterium]
MEYDDEGFETATVTFTFLNPSNYTVMAVTSSYLSIDVIDDTQEFDEQSGFCTVQATVTVNKSSGKYLDSYDIATVRYKRTATSNVQNSVRYTVTGYTSSNGSRTMDVPFYYPLHDAEEWTTIFTSDRADENFRIWNSEEGLSRSDPDAYDWNFNGYYTDSDGKVVYYQSAKTFTFSGSLDGTMFAQNAETGKWEEAYDENGALKTHVLTNMVDYTFSYNSSGAVNYAYWRGAVFPTLSGRITNLTVQNYTSGVLSSSHSNNSSITAKVSSLTVSGNSTLTNIGFIGQLSSNSELENVHIIGAKYAPESSKMSTTNRIGGLVGYSVGYNNYTNCSVTDARISTADDNKSKLYVGGLVGVSSSYDSFTGCFTADLTLETCSSSVSTFDPQGIGGLVSYSTYGSYSGCYSSGTLDSELSYTGGLIGRTLSTTDVACCYSAMNITLNGANSGGLIGANSGTLTLQNCLYTGALSATSTSGTVHLMLGGNSSAATIEGCYAYQPNLDKDSSLLDGDGLTLLTDDGTLTTSFYQTLFGSELYVYTWSVGSTDCSTDSGSEPQYLPGVAADGLLALGQVLDETCYVPTVVADELGISDIWAFETGDRQTISAVTGSPVSASEGFTVSGMNVSYTPNDIEFTLSLGSYGYTVATIEIDGLAAGEIEWTNENKNYTDNTNFDTKGFTTGSKFYAYQVKDGTSTGDYRISLYGAEVVSYQDTYSITVTLTNGIVLKQSFQFRNSAGVEEAKYLEISDAIAWNLYFGSEGELDDLLAGGAYTTYTGYSDLKTNAEEVADLLDDYYGYTYKGYAASSMNIKIAGTIDFSVLDKLETYLAVSESPVMNVQANNVLGEDGAGASVTNLKETALTTTTYGLFKTISGSLTGVDFSDCTLWWASSVGPSNADLVGTLSGGMTDCEFSNITLARGASYFGVVGNGSGVFKNITLSNVSVDTDGSYAGGLVGALHGDLVGVTGSGLDVTGSSYVGGLVGIIYSSEQETSGHELIGGTDYSESAEGTTYTVGGWYETFMSDTGNYPASSSSEYWYRDSLSYDYALVDTISVADVAVTAKTGYVGGIAGQQTYTKSTNVGYGYLIAQHLTAKDVSVYGSGSYTGGLFGFTRTAMVYDVKATSVAVEGGTYGSGGLFGSVYGSTTYDYSACNSSGDRVQYFLSVLYDIACTDISVSGSEQYVGGIYGLGNSATILDAVEMNDVTVLAAATYVGGLYGYNGTVANAYMNEITAKGISIYNTGSSSTSKKYTGGLTGRYGYFRDLDAQDILVLAPGDSSYVGGISGIHPNLYTYATDVYATDDSNTMNTVKNVRVYGRSYVGGIAGSNTSSAIRYLYADGISVTGTGDYVGGLLGYTTVGVSYVTASNITVVGGGAAVGGGAGKAISGNWSHCDFSNVTVTATGTKTATGATSAITSSTDADSIVSGEAVGGLIGAGYGNVVQYDAFTNVKVYDSVSGAQYVGGIFGVVRGGYLTSSSVSKTQVLAANADYVGGVAGYARGANNWGTNALDATVSGGSNVGGMIGYMENTSTTGGMGINKNQIKATVVATGDNVGGAIGGASYLRYLYWNSVEATVTGSSTASDNVGGLVGYMSLASSRSMYDNQVVSVVNGSNYVSGMLGYVDGTLGTDARNNVVATNVTAAENATTSFFYYQTGDGEHQVDVSGNSSSYGYPYYLRLWEKSSITAGSSTTTAIGQTFWQRTGTSTWAKNKLTYWNAGRKGVAQLVTTADLKNTTANPVISNTTYTYKHFDSSCYGLTRTTYSFTVTTENDTTTVSVPNSGLVATSEYWSLLGFETSLTGGSKIYLPSPINPLRLSVDLTENLNESNYYTGNSKVTSSTNGYYFGSASLISASVETNPLVLSYSLTDGICVPGTSGSILSETGTASSSTTVATAPTLSIATAPQVYATGAYTLNVEFSSTDSYAGAWVGVYTDYGTEDEEELVYTFFANSSTLSYSMVYDFSTDITIVVADCGPLAGGDDTLYVYDATTTEGYTEYTTGTQQIVNEISLDAGSLCSRVVLSSGYLYVIGSDGQVYRYKTTYDKETQDLVAEDDNGFIHIYASSSDVLALTGAGKIVRISDSSTDTHVGYTVNVVAGAVADASFTTDSGGTGSVGGTQTASAGQAVGSASSTVNEAGGSWAVATVSGGDNVMMTGSSASEGILLADAACESIIAGADTCTQHYLVGKDLLTGELSAQLRLYATADQSEESSSGSTSDSSTESTSGTTSTDSSGSAVDATSSGSSADSTSTTDSSTSSSGSAVDATSSGSSADSTSSTDSSDGTSDATTSNSTTNSSTATTTSDGSTGEVSSSSGADESESTESALSGSVDSVDLSADDETESDFDESLLDAEPLFEFDYGSYHICTYVTYSLIFDEDGNVTQRNMQLFVKNGQLFALNAPDEVVPGCVIIDTYLTNTYMTVLRNDGVMVDLMDELNYPDDFTNRGIKNLSHNMYSDLSCVLVEYEDGSVISFNYLTGSVLYELEADAEESTYTSSFWSYISSFFRGKLDAAYADVSAAYANAKELKDYLSDLPWKNWFTANSSGEYVDGEAEGGETAASLASESGETDAEADSDAEAGEGDSAALTGEAASTATSGTDSDAGTGVDAALTGDGTSLTSVGTADSGTEATGDESTALTDEELSVASVSIDGDTEAAAGESAALTDEEALAASAGTGIDGEAGTVDSSVLTGEEAEETGVETDSASGTAVGGSSALTGDESAVEETAADAAVTSDEALESIGTAGESENTADTAGTYALEDELIIAYDADANGYALYAASDLLTGSSGAVMSVDSAYKDYIENGGETTAEGTALLSLEVTSQQQGGLIMLGLIGGAVGLMLVVLLVQRSTRRRRRSDRN